MVILLYQFLHFVKISFARFLPMRKNIKIALTRRVAAPMRLARRSVHAGRSNRRAGVRTDGRRASVAKSASIRFADRRVIAMNSRPRFEYVTILARRSVGIRGEFQQP